MQKVKKCVIKKSNIQHTKAAFSTCCIDVTKTTTTKVSQFNLNDNGMVLRR